jgi:hypothetical protein
MRAADAAFGSLRFARSRELHERALAAAEGLPLPDDSLVLAFCLSSVVDAHANYGEDVVAAVNTPHFAQTLRNAWRSDERALALAQRCLALYHTRWRSGTLFTLTPQELAFFADKKNPLLACGERCLTSAKEAVCYWPPLRTPAEEEARLHGVYGALRTALEIDARDDLQVTPSRCALSIYVGREDDAGNVTWPRHRCRWRHV